GMRRLVEGIDRGWGRARAIFHVIDRHGHDVVGLGYWWSEFDLRQGDAGAALRRIFQTALVLGEAGDNVVQEVLGRRMRNIAPYCRDVHHRVASDYTEGEIVVKNEFHSTPLLHDTVMPSPMGLDTHRTLPRLCRRRASSTPFIAFILSGVAC